MLEAVELPAGVTDLATGLADMDGNALALGRERSVKEVVGTPVRKCEGQKRREVKGVKGDFCD
jgi:hypothetical protein